MSNQDSTKTETTTTNTSNNLLQRGLNALARIPQFIQSMTWEGIESVVKKELIQLIRDPFLMAFIITLPIAQLLVTGLAISKDLKHVPIIICNYDNRNESLELVKTFQNSTYFNIRAKDFVTSEKEVMQGIQKGKYRIGIVIPPDYSKELMLGNTSAEVRISIDGTNANIAKSLRAMAAAVVQNYNKERMAAGHITRPIQTDLGSSSAGSGSVGSIAKPATKILYNPKLQTSYFLIPGILAVIMHMMTILLTSFAIVRERESGTLEQLMVTPIRVSDLMVGKVVPYAAIGLFDMALTLMVMMWFFQVDVSGSFWLLCLTSVVFIITSLTIGLLISTTCRSQVQAVQITIGFLLPSLMISGFVFPLDPMPWVVKIFSYMLPITYYLEIIRGVVVKGSGVSELWGYTTLLAAISLLLLGLCVVRFKKQVA